MRKFTINDYIRMAKARGLRLPVQYFFQNHMFDLINGTDTHVRLEKSDYEERPRDFESGVLYMSSVTSEIRNALKKVKRHCGQSFFDHQFFDLGCGKGKSVLVYTMRYGEKANHQAIGIEYYKPLADTANKNLAIAQCSENAAVYHDDARHFNQYLTSGKVILYLYNPFGAEILEDVLNVASELDIWIIYTDPAHHQLLVENGFQAKFSKKGPFPNRTTTIYFRPKQTQE